MFKCCINKITCVLFLSFSFPFSFSANQCIVFIQKTSKTSVCVECRGTAVKGPTGTAELLSSCCGCGISLHSSCASKLANLASNVVPLSIFVKKGSKWLCKECQPTCGACKTSTTNTAAATTASSSSSSKGVCLLMCCTCDKNYHLCCLDPVPVKKPKCPWRWVFLYWSISKMSCVSNIYDSFYYSIYSLQLFCCFISNVVNNINTNNIIKSEGVVIAWNIMTMMWKNCLVENQPIHQYPREKRWTNFHKRASIRRNSSGKDD